jgi:hypothetical protein
MAINMSGENAGRADNLVELGSDDIAKITSVRRGMGKAKYSSLITTIPSDICRKLDIKAGDSMRWFLKKGGTEIRVLKVPAGAGAEHIAEFYSRLDQMIKSGEASEGMKQLRDDIARLIEPSDSGQRRKPAEKKDHTSL